MPIAPVASVITGAAATSTSGGTSAAIDTTGANLLVVWVTYYTGPMTLSDSKGNTWTLRTLSAIGPMNGRFYYCLNPTVGAGHTFTLSGSLGYPVWIAYAFSGVASYQTESTNTYLGPTPPLACGSVTPAANGALILTGLGALEVTPATDTVTPGFGAVASLPFVSGAQVQGSVAYQVQATAAAIDPTWAWSPGQHNYLAAASAVFLPAAAPATVERVESFIWMP